MDHAIDFSQLPTTILVAALLAAVIFAIRYVIKTQPVQKMIRGDRMRATWSESQGRWTYVRESQIHNITSARPSTR